MTTSFNAPDPRFNRRVIMYNPEAIKTALSTYYKALSKLPYVEEDDILYPPASGWPNITASNLEALGKNESVIELLKHLPYLRSSGTEKGYAIYFATFAMDYSGAPFGEPMDVERAVDRLVPFLGADEWEIPAWVVPLTVSEDNVWGTWWLIDTTDGTVTEWSAFIEPDDADYESEDPRAWRNHCGETRLLDELLNEWRENFESLHWVAFSEKVWIDEGVRDHDREKQCEQLQKIIREHGWPNNFRRKECKEALEAWDEQHQDDPYQPY